MVATLNDYQKTRKICKELNVKMIEYAMTIENQILMWKAATTLGIHEPKKDRQDEILVEDESEFEAVQDFILNEPWMEGEIPANMYGRIHYDTLSQTERQFIQSLNTATTSLYQITDVSPEKDILEMKDLLLIDQPKVNVTDLNLSKTVRPGMLIFVRLLDFEGFYMTSGASFLFREGLEKYLVRQSKKLQKRIDSEVESIRRFAAFFHLNRTDGEVTLFEDV